MKKLIYFIVALVVCGVAFESCHDNVTYADMLKDENRMIENLIKDSGIVVISQSEFYAHDSVTDLSRNEYVQLASGVYMQIVDKGSSDPADTIRTNDHVLVRFLEYNISDTMNISCSNVTYPYLVDEFRYVKSGASIMGTFISGAMYATYQKTAVPAGWLTIFPYVRDGAHVKLIVPSKMGHEASMQYVHPYYYDLRRIAFYK
ncbi:MAG: DUF4827 domain-containing protein [Bacteroidales bacterium]|nr:DUF4827 domain-containing protein [Bacteroidaceae bacterium]MDO4185416.1 DUF4827 domain-containing protein [Bacteroidales bacterium]MBQ9882832.1 DUF4827 domain-containing protein [Bacteroidaceae bacterium]MBR2161736.1 DUF4827 domain-containing protein [Bacteroidaceae bacterium]MBR3014457.1 DUF4827 domain-containing protein [Bacteroidaceae bacterium]